MDEKNHCFTTKKCPECLTNLPLNAEKCPDCGKKIGEVDKTGFAKRPVNWLSYIISVLAWVALCLYIWWAFF
ncbi:hypothetical protein BuS5_03395 [Desulfosarcina sp. BuS5]|uniref:zinc ribbon domain-containing protein n=1 Tax=Desulfosarcina sp. BuS5 TaxID=933262 RepID=UPI00048020B1|nr:zinc ribbon domain-containing protein [Desulfosarcina sp. BuS5]WDN90424.1 hypothetical protein BuS5_03395 [Desulfosarcina sp. BuS5]